MTIRHKLSMGIAVLMALFVALGVFSYLQMGQIDAGIEQIVQNRNLGKRAVVLHQQYGERDSELEKARDNRNTLFLELTDALQDVEAITHRVAESPVAIESRRPEWVKRAGNK